MTAMCIVRLETDPTGRPLITLTTNSSIDGAGLERARHLSTVDDAVAAVEAFLRGLTISVADVGESAGTSAGWDDVARAVRRLDELLDSVGDDAQLADVDLQAALEHQQQCLKLMSVINRRLNDTTLAVIRKIGG